MAASFQLAVQEINIQPSAFKKESLKKVIFNSSLTYTILENGSIKLDISDPLFGDSWTGYPGKLVGPKNLGRFSTNLSGKGSVTFNCNKSPENDAFQVALTASWTIGKEIKAKENSEVFDLPLKKTPIKPSSISCSSPLSSVKTISSHDKSEKSTPSMTLLSKRSLTPQGFNPLKNMVDPVTPNSNKLKLEKSSPNFRELFSGKSDAQSTRTIDSVYDSSVKSRLIKKSEMNIRSTTPSRNIGSYSAHSITGANSSSPISLNDMKSTPTTQTAALTHKDSQKIVRSSYFSDKENAQPVSTKRKTRQGYINVGQSCYMASMLHLITTLTLPQFPHAQNEFTTPLARLLSQKLESNTPNPLEFKKEVQKLFRWGSHKQEDAHEYFMYCASYLSGFEWVMLKRISCSNVECSYVNQVEERFNDMSLDFSGISGFFEKENVELMCNCGNDRGVIEKSVGAGPKCLVVHLKRFGGSGQNIWKKESNVEIQDKIDLREWGGCVYVLKCIVNHWGNSVSKGHYTCDVKTREGWASFDDIVRIDIDGDILEDRKSSWYLLGYVKENLYSVSSSGSIWTE